MDAWSRLVRSSYLRTLNTAQLKLTVRIDSFSFKRGIPWDEKGHGGGFVFDCRSLPNPGRFPEYQHVTGNDKEVIDFLQKEKAVNLFMENVSQLVSQSVKNYQQRNFTDLMISFGCTGGQHRSVYCANQLAARLQKQFDLDIKIRHREQEMVGNQIS
jgi:RNase adaptor protein for sRNA GlmZ degradation